MSEWAKIVEWFAEHPAVLAFGIAVIVVTIFVILFLIHWSVGLFAIIVAVGLGFVTLIAYMLIEG